MNKPPPFSNCEVFSPCWCAVAGRENNPHCQKSALPIQNDFLATLIVAGILAYMLVIFKLIKPFSFKRNNWESKN